MANTMSKYGSNTNRPLSEIVGLSTDTKPTDSIEGIQIQNGSSFRELDTGKRFLFDAENTAWNEVSSGGGGGGFTPTTEQLAAMNSGITAEDVEQIETNETNISNQQDTIADGGNGYAIINGGRVYFSDTAPTGTIPTGSIWIGG